jgi:long-chain fatty acid transport protein
MPLHRGSRYWIALAVLTLPAGARAQGFGLNEISACGISRAYAATGTGCRDASTIYWNPGAATSINHWSVVAGVSAISLDGKFEQDTTFATFKGDVPTAWVPNIFVNYHDSTSAYAYGIGLYVPYGLTSQWTSDFPGRFLAKKAAIQSIYVQPNFAWRINEMWSVGAGPIIAHSHVELIQALDLSQQSITVSPTLTIGFAQLGIAKRTEFAQAKLDGGAWGFGGHFGVQLRPNADWSVGARFLTPVKFSFDEADATFTQVPTNLVIGGAIPNPANPTGPPLVPAGTPVDPLLAAQFAPGGALVSQSVKTKITDPAQVQVGVAYTGFRNWELEADYAWVGWRQFKELPLDFANNPTTPNRTLIENFNNSSSIRLGAEYRFQNDIHVRAGFAGVAAAAPDETVTPLLPDQDRANYAIGAAFPVLSHWVIDAGYVRVQTPGRRGRIDERTSPNQTAAQLNTGVYTLNANIFTVGIKTTF